MDNSPMVCTYRMSDKYTRLSCWKHGCGVRLPALVMLETWPRESWVPRLYGTFFDKLFFFLYRIITLPLSTLTAL